MSPVIPALMCSITASMFFRLLTKSTLDSSMWVISQSRDHPSPNETDSLDQAINPNISGFAGPSHNGKLIHYVGWADQLISPGNSLHYYETVNTFMSEHTEMNIDDFYRLFTVGGMQHWYVSTFLPRPHPAQFVDSPSIVSFR